MFDIGLGEMALLAAIALVAIGPKQLPEMARVLGRFMNDMKRTTGEFTSVISDVRNSANDVLHQVRTEIDTTAALALKNEDHPLPPPIEAPPAEKKEEQLTFQLIDDSPKKES